MGSHPFTKDLILRSHAKRGVSKDGNEHLGYYPSFETHPSGVLLRMRLP